MFISPDKSHKQIGMPKKGTHELIDFLKAKKEWH